MEKRLELGEWLGLCKYDNKGKPRKVRGASAIAINDYGEVTEALNFVLEHINSKK
jgi:hypothetical protein